MGSPLLPLPTCLGACTACKGLQLPAVPNLAAAPTNQAGAKQIFSSGPLVLPPVLPPVPLLYCWEPSAHQLGVGLMPLAALSCCKVPCSCDTFWPAEVAVGPVAVYLGVKVVGGLVVDTGMVVGAAMLGTRCM